MGADGCQSEKYLSAVGWEKVHPARSELRAQFWGNGGHGGVWREMCLGAGGWSLPCAPRALTNLKPLTSQSHHALAGNCSALHLTLN